MKTTEIRFKVSVDENNLPEKIEWEAPESGEQSECNSLMVALWDARENNTLRIDLWTKSMSVDEMKKFYHQNLVTLTETYLRATGDEATANKARAFFTELGKGSGVLR
ncbi:MAG TPA: gliding motility protein GldC [Bacteroidia bacterium]|nr:gliding motility protein GldC [Bacteroidia bacterium]